YFAVTSNSVQTGAGLSLFGSLANSVSASGYFRFDALLTWNPFHFSVGVAAGISVGVDTPFGYVSVAGVRLEGRLSGPNPFELYGKFELDILCIPITWEDTFYFGETQHQETILVASVLPVLTTELRNARNLEATAASDGLVGVAAAGGWAGA